jgi:hypothetical protein
MMLFFFKYANNDQKQFVALHADPENLPSEILEHRRWNSLRAGWVASVIAATFLRDQKAQKDPSDGHDDRKPKRLRTYPSFSFSFLPRPEPNSASIRIDEVD